MLGDWKKGFTVEIQKTKNVSILKDEIKKKRARRLSDVDASDLELFQVSIPTNDNAEEIFKNLDQRPLNYLSRLSQLFPFVEENSLHIVVEVPAKGEFI